MVKFSKTKIIFVVFLVFLIFLPFLVLAKGLVPCGGEGEPVCNLCHVAMMANNIIQFLLFTLVLPAGTLALIIAGVLILTASGSEDQITKGKNIFKQVVIGLLVAFSAWLIVNTILGNLLDRGYLPVWSKFPNCEENLFPALSSSPRAQGSSAVQGSSVSDGVLGEQEARSELSAAGIGVKTTCPVGQSTGCVKLDGIQQVTLDGLEALKNQSGADMYVTGGTEGGHTEGKAYGHDTGYKVDLRPNNTLDSYIKSFPKGAPVDGYDSYNIKMDSYQIRAVNENDHWDLRIINL